MTITTLDTLALQQAREEDGAFAGYSKYLEGQNAKALREGFDRRADVQKMIRGAIPLVADAIRAWVASAETKKGRPSAALAPLKEVDADVIAYCGLSKTFMAAAKDMPLTNLAAGVGRTIQAELEALAIQVRDPKAAKRFLRLAEGEARESVNRKRHEDLTADLDVSLDWTSRTQVIVGSVVVNCILTAVSPIFERGIIKDYRGTVPVIVLTDEALGVLATMAERAAWLQPVLKPMVVKPRAWERYDTGAYLSPNLSRTVPLVKTFSREHQKLIKEAIRSGECAELLEGLNAIQETRFAIDKRVLEVIQWTRLEAKQPSKSFPLSTLPLLPEKTTTDEWLALDPAARSVLSRRRKAIRDIREAAGIDGGVFNGDIMTAEDLSIVPEFYLPASLDFRGRVYAVPHFNPQRSDHIKAMFHFAEAVPLGADGGMWLSIHLANCGDFEKVSKQPFDVRCNWVKENIDKIIDVARDPAGTYEFWGAASEPFCFLQACFEYGAWAASGFSPEFPSTIGVALDGSCSGLQHYSAMTRSEEEGYHVNLLPRDTVGDIYGVVAVQATSTLSSTAEGGCISSAMILANGFGRSECKTNVMTYFYGSSQFGMRDQHMDSLMRPLGDKVTLNELGAHPYAMTVQKEDKETGEVTERLDGGFTCAMTLAQHIYAAVVTVAPKADEAAQWFQQVAAILAHESLPVIWKTPVGLPVVQRYSEYTSKVVNLWLYDRKVMVPTSTDKLDDDGNVLARLQCLVREAPTKRINKKKARSAISPNVVHSLDGSHLVRAVVMAKREGITAFQLIHDSFATHAGNTGKFFRVIREAFVSTYETYCPFTEIDTYARSVLSEDGIEKLPPIPAKGTLDLKAVLASDFAFA